MLHRIRIALAATPAPARRSEVPDAGTRGRAAAASKSKPRCCAGFAPYPR